MFVVKCKNAFDYGVVTNILSTYDVHIKMDVGVTTMLVVTERNGNEQDYRLCEMAFQMNMRQEGNLCPVCRARIEETGEGDAVCGHLTFTTVK